MSDVLDLVKASDGMFKLWEPGMIITEPGAYLNMPMSVYHGQPCDGPSISSSQLRKIFAKSLAHYWDESPLNEDRQPFEDTEFTILGRAAHHLLFGQEKFDEEFIIRPETAPDGSGPWNGQKKSCKAWLAEQALEGLTVVTPGQIEQIHGMERALLREPAVEEGILNGMIELSMFWKDAETGIWKKSRPDSIPNDADVADLKAVSDVTTDGIEKSLGTLGYHAQGAMVREGMLITLKRVMNNFFLVYVEGKRPHSVRIDTVHPSEIEAGARENRVALHLFARALKTNYWPGPKNMSGDGGFISRTKFARERAERHLKQIEADLGL